MHNMIRFALSEMYNFWWKDKSKKKRKQTVNFNIKTLEKQQRNPFSRFKMKVLRIWQIHKSSQITHLSHFFSLFKVNCFYWQTTWLNNVTFYFPFVVLASFHRDPMLCHQKVLLFFVIQVWLHRFCVCVSVQTMSTRVSYRVYANQF